MKHIIASMSVALMLVLSACTPAQVQHHYSLLGVDLSDQAASDIAEWVEERDCLPNYDAEWLDQYTECAVYDAAIKYGIPVSELARVGWCETKLGLDTYNESSGASGVMQFMPRTWEWVASNTGYTDIWNERQNVFNAAWLWSLPRSQGGGPQHWTCY